MNTWTIEEALKLLQQPTPTPTLNGEGTAPYFFYHGQLVMHDPPHGSKWAGTGHGWWENALKKSDCTGYRPMLLGETIVREVDEFWQIVSETWVPFSHAHSKIMVLGKSHTPFRTTRPMP